MKGLWFAAALLGLSFCLAGGWQVASAYSVHFDFDTMWTGDYAPGWENSAYRHGAPPVGKMMEFTTAGVGGSGAMKLIADSTPESWMWWAGVNPTSQNVRSDWMTKQYNPWVSVDYFDEGWETGNLHRTGQLYAVPSWVNPYINGSEDWTDVQLGGRINQASPNDNYWHVSAGQNSPGWQDTGVDRVTNAWVNLKMQLSSADGKIHFYVNGVERGASYRSDYIDLIGIGLYCMFTDPLSAWGTEKPAVYYDNFEYGSSAVPEPTTFALVGLGILGLGVARLRKRG